MRYIVIIYYVLIEGEQVFETLNVNKNIAFPGSQDLA